MRNKSGWMIGFGIFVLAFLNACAISPLGIAFVQPTYTPLPTYTLQPTYTAVPSSTPTQTATPRPTKTITLTPTKKPTLKPTLPIINKNANDINLNLLDLLDTDYILTDEITGVAAGEDPTMGIKSASQHWFIIPGEIGFIVVTVKQMDTTQKARFYFSTYTNGDTYEKILKKGFSGVTKFEKITDYPLGDESILFKGADASLGNVFDLEFRKLNILVSISAVGEEISTEEVLVFAKLIEAKIK